MINKMADEASAILYLICWHEVWVKVTYDWSTEGPRPCAMSTQFSLVKATSISTSTSANLSVFLVLMLLLMSTKFSVAYTCA